MEAATAEMTVVERFQLKAFVEAVMLVDEGVSTTKDTDLGMMMGAGILPGPLAPQVPKLIEPLQAPGPLRETEFQALDTVIGPEGQS